MPKYVGKCVGGPYDGRLYASETKTFCVVAIDKIMFTHDLEDLSKPIETVYTYRHDEETKQFVLE